MAKKQSSDAVYKDFERVTQDLGAWAVLKNGEYVAKVVTHTGGRRSPNGLTVRAFVHVFGLPMVRGIARGYGYDMRTAAILSAGEQLTYSLRADAYQQRLADVCADFRSLKDNGHDWTSQLSELGYVVEWVV